MATNSYRGDAQARAQITTLTVGGTAQTGDILNVFCNNKTVSYTLVVADTLLTAAANLLTAILEDADGGEFGDFNATQPDAAAAVIQLEATEPGRPFTVTVSVTGSGPTTTLTAATPTTSTGPFHYDEPTNWTLGAVPVDTNDVVFDFDAPPCLYGLDAGAGVTPASLLIRSQRVGLDDRNPNEYLEYRVKELQFLQCTNVRIESAPGITPERIRVRLVNSAASTIVINAAGGGNTQRTADGPLVRLTSGGAGVHTVHALSGSIGLACGIGETFRVGTLNVGTFNGINGGVGDGALDENPFVQIGSGTVMSGTATAYAGVVDSDAAFTVINLRGLGSPGPEWIQRVGGGNTVDATAGIYRHRSSGNIATTINFRGNSVFDTSGGTAAFTIPSSSNVTFKGGAYPHDPAKRMTSLAFTTDRLSILNSDMGDEYVLTRS